MGAIGLRASRRFARFCSSKTSTFTSRPHASQAVGSLRPKKQKAREGGPFFGGDWTQTNADRSRGIYSPRQASSTPPLTKLISLIINILYIDLRW